MEVLKKTVNNITGLDSRIMEESQLYLDGLLKPKGSLGKLEEISKQLAGITGKVKNKITKKRIIAMAGDNGVTEEMISPFPQEVSTLVAETMAGDISGVAVLAKHAGADVQVVDLGLNSDPSHPAIINRKIRKSTSNIVQGPAMSREEAIKAIEIGIEITNKAIDEGVNLLGTGEVGIGNTTTSSAVLYAFTGADLDIIVGRGAGLDDEGLARKKEVVKKAVEINKPDKNDAIDVVAKVGGFDIAGLAGCYLAAAARKVPIVIDGFISSVAALVAKKIKEEVVNYMIPSHITEEPGGKLLAKELSKTPYLFMNLRLGEGTGAALAFHMIEAACAMTNDMGTFADIGM